MAVFPIYNALLLPDTRIYLKTARVEQMLGRPPRPEERVTLLVLRRDETRSLLKSTSFYPVGVSGTVVEIHEEGWFAVQTRSRVNLDEIILSQDGRIEAYTSPRPDSDRLDPREDARIAGKAKEALLAFVKGTQWEETSRKWLNQFSTLNDVAAACAVWMDETSEDKYALLEEDSAVRRAGMLEKMIFETLEMGKLSQEGSSVRQEDYQKTVRESAIKKQMEYLQKELDEMHPENGSDLKNLEVRIRDSGMNETARREADKILRRLKQEGASGPESGMLYNYLDFVTGLSWKKETAGHIDLDEAEKILEEDHFGLRKVKNRILQQIAVMDLTKRQSGSILLFVGAPGTGKTSIGQSIAKALGRKYVRVSLGGVRDEADIRGHRRTYIGAMPGRIMDAIHKSGVSNPVMVLDEVDKLGVSYNGDPASALLEVLDPEQNSTFTDHYMNVPYDLSDVLFICTANSTDTIPEPLLNRMEVLPFQGYTPIEKLQIAVRHLLPNALKAAGLKPEELTVTDEAIRTIISDYTREAGVRGLKQRLDTLCRSAAVRIVQGGKKPLVIVPEDLRECLDAHPLPRRSVRMAPAPGIMTGLAWTAAGGDILYIEAMFAPGNGQIIITGQLGDVMKESVRLAISLIKHRFPDKASLFAENDLHIHVPDGSTPKDGPSAGITLTCAIASLVNGTVVDSGIAMTGEISLRGEVTAIGGLAEKLMAAQRAGVTRVLVPEENQDDLTDVPGEILKQLTVIPIRTLEQALSFCGIVESPAVPKAV